MPIIVDEAIILATIAVTPMHMEEDEVEDAIFEQT